MVFNMLQILLFIIIQYVFIALVSCNNSLKLIDLNNEYNITLSKSKSIPLYCLDNHNTKDIHYWFSYIQSFYHRVVIKVSIVNENTQDNISMDWHTIRGKSTDDFHSHIQSIIFYIFQLETIYFTYPDLNSSFLRDIVSACPSPLFTRDRTTCQLTFTTISSATNCISIDTKLLKNDTTFRITSYIETNWSLIIKLLLGFGFLLFSSSLSSSAIFQYSFGSLLFISLGLGLIILILLHQLNRRKTYNKLSRISFIFFFFGGYGASCIYFLKVYLKNILLQYWEIVLGYLLFMIVIGFISVKMIRGKSNEPSQIEHRYRVLIKWLIRITGCILIYNSTSSPLISLFLIVTACLIYLIYQLRK